MNMHNGPVRMRLAAALTGLALLVPVAADALDLPDRRRSQFGVDYGHYFYPLAGDIPGLGSAQGVGATVLNMAGSDTDFTGFFLKGDFDATGAALLDLHLRPRRLLLDVGYYTFDVSPVNYERGILSSPDNFVLPRAKGEYGIAQLTLSFRERQLEAYFRGMMGGSELVEVRDKDGTPFAAVDTDFHSYRSGTIGFTADLTDDRVDPRTGIRLEASANFPSISSTLQSRYYVTNGNLTGYVPLRKRRDTLAFNAFYSSAHVTSRGPTDFATLQTLAGLNCGAIPAGPARDQCLATEADYLDQLIASNLHGNAGALGGTQRLRSFDNGRFFAGNALFYGVEYRWNLTDEHTPFDFWIARGVRTGIQVAFFAEQGTVTDYGSELLEHLRTSYGAGFRLVLSGIVVRADIATGNEGEVFQLFITYPWSMFSVDSPG